MKFIFIVIFSFTLSYFSAINHNIKLIDQKPKLCIDCKFYKPPTYFFTSNDFGKCSLFPYYYISDSFLVNGVIKKNTKEEYYCATARKYNDMCGKEGKFYQKI